MSEAAEVRLVRCPKCDKLLPEVTDFSVYQCGGCGAVLRAKNEGVDLDTFSEKSDEERIGGTMEKLSDRYEKMMNVSERRMIDMSDGSESDVRSSISSSSRAERRRICRDRTENDTTSLTSKEKKWDVEADIVQDKRSDELHRSRISHHYENMVMHHADENSLRRSSRIVDEEKGGFGWAKRMDPTIALSNGVSWSSCNYEDSTRNRSDGNESNDLENIGEDRAELLRKLDELEDQLRRSGDLIDKGKEKIPHDPYLYDNGYGIAHFKRPVYQNQYSEPPSLMHRQEMGGNGFYPPRYVPQGYGIPMRSPMHRRGPTPHAYTSGPYMDDGMVYMDPMEPYPTNFMRHHPSCSCHQCRSKRRVSTPIIPTSYSDKYSNVSNDMIPNYHGTPGYNQRMSMSNPPPLRSHVPQTHARWPSHVNSQVDDNTLHRPPRARLATSRKNCRPIAGGAPFLACYNCFELLQLTKKVLTKNNTRKKLRCGGCSTVIVFAVSEKGLIDVEAKDSPIKFGNKSDVLSTHGDACLNQARTAFSSDDYDNSGYDLHSVDREPGQVSTRNKSSATKDHLSTSMYTSEVEEDTESLAEVKTGSSVFADLAAEDKGPTPPAGSALQDYSEYSNKYRVVKDSGEGNRSGRLDYVKTLPNKAIERQILRKESTATEIDLSSNEYCNTGTTLDSSEASREGHNLKTSGGAESFFAGIVKNSFKDSQKYKDAVEQEKGNVTVNGHLISDRLIKKAEKLAGPIHPGHYWYDFRAGFWGAIGGPCLGIVPPFIEEFNYPLQEHCACGNTGVFVNGRELNRKDLNLLGSRGLPMERDRSYIIEISGRVLDGDTGEELESLGKLAPTVEKMKRGFGMRAPKAVA